jgi:hypothetical protein
MSQAFSPVRIWFLKNEGPRSYSSPRPHPNNSLKETLSTEHGSHSEGQQIPRLFWKLDVHLPCLQGPTTSHILCHTNLVSTLTLRFCKVYINIILPRGVGLLSGPFHSGLYTKFCIWATCCLHLIFFGLVTFLQLHFPKTQTHTFAVWKTFLQQLFCTKCNIWQICTATSACSTPLATSVSDYNHWYGGMREKTVVT